MRARRKNAYIISRVPEETVLQVSEIAYRRGISNSEALREALDAWIVSQYAQAVSMKEGSRA